MHAIEYKITKMLVSSPSHCFLKPACYAISSNSRALGGLLADLLVLLASTLPPTTREFKPNKLLLPE